VFQDSECDRLGGFDGATLPPGLDQSATIDMFISLMCRKLDLVFEKVKIFFKFCVLVVVFNFL
jgi:hypothetical protein